MSRPAGAGPPARGLQPWIERDAGAHGAAVSVHRPSVSRCRCAVLVPERRGYGKSDGPTFADVVGTSRGATYVRRLQEETGDALAAVDDLLSRHSSRLDPRKVAIMGFSAGGVVTVFGAARSGRFAAVVTQASGAFSWPLSPELNASCRRSAPRPRSGIAWSRRTTRRRKANAASARREANGAAADLMVYPHYTPKRGSRRRRARASAVQRGGRVDLATRRSRVPGQNTSALEVGEAP